MPSQGLFVQVEESVQLALDLQNGDLLAGPDGKQMTTNSMQYVSKSHNMPSNPCGANNCLLA